MVLHQSFGFLDLDAAPSCVRGSRTRWGICLLSFVRVCPANHLKTSPVLLRLTEHFKLVSDTRLASMAPGSWLFSHVVDLINRSKSSSSRMMVEGRPLVSTFEGPDWAGNWARVRDKTGGICLIPDWSSLVSHGVGQRLDCIDRSCKLTAALRVGAVRLRDAVSWDAWPKTGHSRMRIFCIQAASMVRGT